MHFVRAGTLDGPTAITPDVHIYTRSKGQVGLPEGTPAFDVSYNHGELWPPWGHVHSQMTLLPDDRSETPITEFLLRIEGDEARLRY